MRVLNFEHIMYITFIYILHMHKHTNTHLNTMITCFDDVTFHKNEAELSVLREGYNCFTYRYHN